MADISEKILFGKVMEWEILQLWLKCFAAPWQYHVRSVGWLLVSTFVRPSLRSRYSSWNANNWSTFVRLQDFEKERVESVLKTVYNTNVIAFGGGKLGAVNGMTRSGQLETVSMQSEEIWTGVTHGLASTMMMEVRRLLKRFRMRMSLSIRIWEAKHLPLRKAFTILVTTTPV